MARFGRRQPFPPRASRGLLEAPISGTIAATDGRDTAAGSGLVIVSGLIDAVDGRDTGAASGAVIATGTVAVTDGRDTAIASGVVGDNISGTIAATDGRDTASASGTVSGGQVEPELVYRGHRKRHRLGDDVSYEDVVKAWEVLELRRHAQAKRKPGADPEESLDRISPEPLAPAAVTELAPVLSPLLKIDLDWILTRKVLDDAADEVERHNAMRAAIAEVEEMELLVLMAVAAADDDD